ncbi:hypothetical protein LP420_41080 [Massilia sp. B-10]|nr:hypothetical protein LP420_41080 [Massilia sp. B-10]
MVVAGDIAENLGHGLRTALFDFLARDDLHRRRGFTVDASRLVPVTTTRATGLSVLSCATAYGAASASATAAAMVVCLHCCFIDVPLRCC